MNNKRFKKIDPDLNKDFLIEKIKDSLLVSTYRKVKYARNLFGVLLAQQNGCYYGGIAKELKNEIGNEGFKKLINADGKLTLTFVVDIGRRMKTNIGTAIAVAKDIARYDYKSDVDYVLSTFSMGTDDRSLIGDVKTYGTLAEFEKALDDLGNSEFPEENKEADCFQPTYAGIIRGITQGYPRKSSPIFVFTNNLPRPFGEYTLESAKYHAKRNKMSVNVFVMKPYCSTKSKGRYKLIIWSTGGFLWLIRGGYSSVRKDLKKIETKVKKNLVGTFTIVSRHVKRQSKPKRGIEISVGEFVIDDIAQCGTIDIQAINMTTGESNCSIQTATKNALK
ncbi:hypothetical protein AC249_AIPGENE15933 [Exaiptasia diaphana]|nr:hypothetical protein AC249_AIPGENE15933 [Exaiptasia diaphana]